MKIEKLTKQQEKQLAVYRDKWLAFESANDNSVIYLRVNNTTALLEHLRGFDTHQAWSFSDGIYTMRRQVESWLEGFRKAID